jgi:hypothetical protein
MPARAPIAASTASARTQNCLIVAGRTAAKAVRTLPADERGDRSKGRRVCISIVMSKILHVMIVRRAPRLLPPRGACPNSKGVKALQLAFDRFGGFADQGGHPLPRTPCKAYQPANGFDQRIAVVFKVELESLGHRYCRAS